MKIVFMGTPDIAKGCLEKLINEKLNVVGVVTQADKPIGRGKKMGMPPVKELALQHNIPVYQPIKARDEEFINTLKEINPDLIIVVAMVKFFLRLFLIYLNLDVLMCTYHYFQNTEEQHRLTG